MILPIDAKMSARNAVPVAFVLAGVGRRSSSRNASVKFPVRLRRVTDSSGFINEMPAILPVESWDAELSASPPTDSQDAASAHSRRQRSRGNREARDCVQKLSEN